MPVDSKHPEYDASVPAWSRARDVLAGEDAVKAAGSKYLPRLDAQSDEDYEAYRARASFFGATARTVEEYLDLVFRRAPTIGFGERKPLEAFVGDCDLWGMDFLRYARQVVGEVLSVGRVGSLVLWDEAGNRPWVSLWRAEDIINWRMERVGQAPALVEVVLRERGIANSQSQIAKDGERIRVLKLQDGTDGKNGTNACVMEVWGHGSPPSAEGSTGARDAWVLEESVTLLRDGVPVPFIPFVFHGPRNSRPEPDRLPLAEIIAANLDLYRLDADYKHGLHFTALPTAWVSGFNEGASLRIGPSAVWFTEVPGATAGFLEFSGAGLAHLERAMDKVERRMALLGARLGAGAQVDGLPGGESSEPAGESELFGLGSIVASLNGSLSQVLRMAQWWVEGGELSAQTASIVMDTDICARRVTGEMVNAVVAAWREGAMSRDSMLKWLKRWEVLPDGRSVAEELSLIHGKARAQV